MNFRLHRLLVIIVVLVDLMSCSRRSKREIAAGQTKIESVVKFLEMNHATSGCAPNSQRELESAFRAATGKPYPDEVHYMPMDSDGYKLYCYIHGRTALLYLSKDDGSQHKGWWIDDESGDPPIEL